jgi:argininosuccinate lyase
MAKLWEKGKEADKRVEKYTTGRDRELDLRLAVYDIKGSIAHITMLESIGLLTQEELFSLRVNLEKLLEKVEGGEFVIEEGVEDIHSQVEIYLTEVLGETGKKIHSGRSRNDQVLLDIKLFLKDEILKYKNEILTLFNTLQSLSEEYKDILMPGYTHGQIAMPSSFGLWFGAYAEALIDDIYSLTAAYKIVNQNPLGSAAGYGNSFPLDREMTTKLLGFETMNYNSIAAQLSRGKSEKVVTNALSSIAYTLNKLASDCCLFMGGNFGFISFPDEFTTGSSIMPHKKNPDVWELIRANCNRIAGVSNEISLLCANLPHGYHRDYQLLKDILFPALERMHESLYMANLMLQQIKINPNLLDDPRYDYLFTVEAVNRLVLSGVPFREAYRKVGDMVARGEYVPDKKIAHTHKGSTGNLCNAEIRSKMEQALDQLK